MQVVETQLQSLSALAEKWRDDPVQQACDSEELAAAALSLWRIFKDRIETRPTMLDEEEEIRLAHANRETVQAFARLFDLLRAIDETLRKENQRIHGLDDLASARHEVRELLSISLDDVISGYRHAREGKGRSLAEVRRALQSRIQP